MNYEVSSGTCVKQSTIYEDFVSSISSTVQFVLFHCYPY